MEQADYPSKNMWKGHVQGYIKREKLHFILVQI